MTRGWSPKAKLAHTPDYDNALCGSKTQPQAQPGMMDNNPLGVRLERRAVKVVWCAVLTAPGAHHDKYAGARNLV